MRTIPKIEFRRNLPNPSADTALAGEAGSFHSTAGAEELRGGR